jgi:hypothetical protein
MHIYTHTHTHTQICIYMQVFKVLVFFSNDVLPRLLTTTTTHYVVQAGLELKILPPSECWDYRYAPPHMV